jgi:hypothetical protein
VRRCPYCAEEIQDAAVVCRFCGRSVKPVAASEPPAPRQSWYRLDERVRRATGSKDARPKPSLWSKLGGAAMNAFAPRRHEDEEPQARVSKYAKIATDRKTHTPHQKTR